MLLLVSHAFGPIDWTGVTLSDLIQLAFTFMVGIAMLSLQIIQKLRDRVGERIIGLPSAD